MIKLYKNQNKKIFFLHVPKCGGTSIDSAIRKKFGKKHIFHLGAQASAQGANIYFERNEIQKEQYYHVLKYRGALLLYAMSHENIKYVSGHFYFSEKAYRYFTNDYKFITILREPVHRWISHYFYNRYKKSQHRQIESDIDSYIESNEGSSLGTEFVKFYGGIDANNNYRNKDMINQAKKNFEKFDLVGILEDTKDFTIKIKTQLGIKLNISKRNESHVTSSFKVKILTAEILEKIRVVCKPDHEIYQFVKENFIHQSN